jgi:very-short-patch-repair endonuclease
MVTCQICKHTFNRITQQHLKKHGTTIQKYELDYPGYELVSQETRERYRQGTKKHYDQLTREQRSARVANRVYSVEGREAILKTLEYGRSCIDYSSLERNDRISVAKKDWWSKLTKEERSLFVKQKVVAVARNKKGEEQYLKELRKKGIQGYKKLIGKGVERTSNQFELEMYERIAKLNFEYKEQYEIDGWFYDCYVPSKNLLIEFDGDYWHPATLEDCKDARGRRQYSIDRKKEKVAQEKGYKVVRIRQSEKHKLENLLSD